MVAKNLGNIDPNIWKFDVDVIYKFGHEITYLSVHPFCASGLAYKLIFLAVVSVFDKAMVLENEATVFSSILCTNLMSNI